MYVYYNNTLNSPQNEKFSIKAVQKITTHFMFKNVFFFPQNLDFCETTRKNMVQLDKPQTAI
jgi:hypothetical protein